MNLKSLRERIDELNREHDQIQSQIMSLRGRLADLDESLQQLEKTGSVAEIAACRAERQRLLDLSADLEAKIDRVLGELAGVDRTYHEKSNTAWGMTNQAEALRAKLGPGGTHQTEIEKLTNEYQFRLQILKNSQAVDQRRLDDIEKWLSEHAGGERVAESVPGNHRLAGRSQRVIWW